MRRNETRELLEQALQGSVQALAVAVEARDDETGEHSEALVALARGAGERLGRSDDDLSDVAAVARLDDRRQDRRPRQHPAESGPLDPEEREVAL